MVKIDKDKCIGCGACEAVCPKSFKMNDEMKAEYTGVKAPCIKEGSR